MTDFIYQSGYWFIPLLTFIFISGVAGLMGAWNGWKTVTYFFGWNLAALIAGVVAMDAMVDQVAEPIMTASKIDIHSTTTALSIAEILILISLLFATNILAFIFYWFFRKKLKARIKENKIAGISNAAARWGGTTMAVITALPITFGMAAVANITSDQEDFDHFINSTLKGITFGQIDGLYGDDKDALSLLLDESVQDDITKLFDPKAGEALSTEAKDKIIKLINSDKGLEIMGAVAEGHSGDKTSAQSLLDDAPTPLMAGVNLTNQDEFIKIIAKVALEDGQTLDTLVTPATTAGNPSPSQITLREALRARLFA